ncbi:hypothetical protein FBQ84_03485 [Ignavibacteria bacterium CHB1]|nr:MAG: hypothetical protein EDM69_02970 [Chlorobiota bacterium]MBV6398440.1 hypothetical protein [Ignavibacteria bacterium]MDL1886892.1 hypothetical protein [Ignavibacteria bacterium CHB1]RIK50412.1 MAG: hypothetical protein DCC60_01035 [Ignavibacteriota bacterium]
MLQLKINNMRVIIIIPLLFLLVSVNSCGEKNDKDKPTVENTGDKVKENGQQTEGEVNKKPAEDKKKVDSSNDLGMTPGLPPDYPEDVPQPPGGKVLGSLNSSEGTVVTFESTESIPAIVDHYKSKLKDAGYELSEGGEMLITDQGGLIGWKKGEKEVSLMLGRDTEKGISSVVVTYN